MSYQIEVVEMTASVLAAVRARTSRPELGKTIIESLDKVYAFLKTARVQQQGHNVVVYADDLWTIEAGVEVAAAFESSGSVVCSATPSGLAARTCHIGPYSDLPNAHLAVREWCTTNNRKLKGPHWEVYGDWDSDPKKLRTDVYYVIQDG